MGDLLEIQCHTPLLWCGWPIKWYEQSMGSNSINGIKHMSELVKWAAIERAFIQEDIKWLKAGGKLISPSGDDITAKGLEDLEARLEHADKVIEANVDL